MKRRLIGTILGLGFLLSLFGGGTAHAVKPAQGSTFETGECTTTSGHGTNAFQVTDNGNCDSADNPNKGSNTSGTNTGHGFEPD